tara:strand:- start:5343 stop:6062 length:720 start_codon:yes stop_codon:yes gene_type:complete
MSKIIYTSRRNISVTYSNNPEEHPLYNFINDNTNHSIIRDRMPSLVSNCIPRNLGESFWGRVTGFDHTSVKAMIKKQPELVNAVWGDLDIITLLFHKKYDGNKIVDNLPQEEYDNHSKRFVKMLRILTRAGAKIDSQKLLPYIERHSYHDEKFASRVFNCLLHKGLYCMNYKLLSEEEIMYLEQQKHDRGETYVYWGRKVVSDYLRIESRKIMHVYLRDLCPTSPKLCYDVIGAITSFL